MTDSPTEDSSRLRPLLRAWWRLLLRLRLPLLRRQIRTCRVEAFDGLNIVVLPGVLNPVLLRSGAFLAQYLRDHHAIRPPVLGSKSAPKALDMGTGSGIGALVAARGGYDVVAVDINPVAVRCARANAVLNGLDDRIHVLEGDLFDPLPDDARFDLVAFNPPFFRGTPRDPGDSAWRGEGLLERFAAGLERVLTIDGVAVVLLSTDGAEDSLEILHSSGFRVHPAASHDFGNETMTVYMMSQVGMALRNGVVEPCVPGAPQS